MHTTNNLRFARSFIKAAAAISILAAGAFPSAAQSGISVDRASPYGALIVADAHAYRHCHNLSMRTYCHKADRLPQNWPPNSDTPHRQNTESDNRKDHVTGSRGCASNFRYRKGQASAAAEAI